jgi:Outer membrane protein beta-barrel domain
MTARFFSPFLLFALSVPAVAQYAPPAAGLAGEPAISPNRGQDQHQLQFDRYECYGWAKRQSSYDPARPGNAMGQDMYRRAFSACMSGRGYTVSYAAAAPNPSPPATPAPTTPVPPVYVRQYWWESPELVYRPVHFAIEGGYTATTGSTSDNFDDGGNVGVGISFFPSRSLPIGLRIDGSWSRFDASHAYFDTGGDYYQHSHENIYGGDADLQFNLAHTSSRYQFYLLGGAGWYREQHVLEQFATGCGFHYCGPILAGEQSSTTDWRSSWNAGFGGEFAMPGGASFFVEARYQRIAPRNSDMQFVPVRVGIRF